jgi:hypothetical protein
VLEATDLLADGRFDLSVGFHGSRLSPIGEVTVKGLASGITHRFVVAYCTFLGGFSESLSL